MSATNRTDNYNLPIFIETDKPAWLVDFNGAMRSIDAQMKSNAEAIATKSPILTFQDTSDIDFTKTGDIITANLQSAITDKVGRALVTPLTAPASDQLVAINDSGAQEALDIGTGLLVENNTLNAIDLNFDIKENASFSSGLPSGVTLENGFLTLACNSDRTVGKIYGTPNFRNTGSSLRVIDFDTGLVVSAPAEQYSIVPVGIGFPASPSTYGGIFLEIHTNGHIYLKCNCFPNTITYNYLFPSIYIFKDFGDVPTP